MAHRFQTNGFSHNVTYTMKSGWPIVYIEGSQITRNIVSMKIDSVPANSADPDDMPHYAAYHLCLRCFPKYPFRGFWYPKGYVTKHQCALNKLGLLTTAE